MAQLTDYIHRPDLRTIESRNDVIRLNRFLRTQLPLARTPAELTALVRRAHHLCALLYGPLARQHWTKGELNRLQQRALLENRRTVALANQIARDNGWDLTYEPWDQLSTW
jgi:hypothetical protein